MTITVPGNVTDAETIRLLERYCEIAEKFEALERQAMANGVPAQVQVQKDLQDTIKTHCRQLGVQIRTLAISINATAAASNTPNPIPVDANGCPDGWCFDGVGCVPCNL